MKVLTGDFFRYRCIRVENVEGPNEIPELNHPVVLQIKQVEYLHEL
jgi:hypothetical protein